MEKKEASIFDIVEFSYGRKFGLLGKLYFSTLSNELKYVGIEKNFSVLVLLDEMGDKCTQKFISDTLHIDKTMMVAVADDLMSKGFITRVQNPADRRAYWIRLTARAKKRIREIKEKVKQMNELAMTGLTEAEVKLLNKQMCTIYKNLKKLPKQLHP